MPGSTLAVSAERAGLDPQRGGLAQEREAGVLLERAREEPGLGEHLEAVADPDDRAARGGELADRGHDR